MIHIFVCEDSVDGIFTAVYDAWASGFGHANVKLQIEGECNLELFSDYIPVTTDYEKSEKVARSVRRKISEEAFFMIYRTCFSFDTEKADAIYRFLLWGFRYGSKVVSMLAEPAVHRVFELQRKVNNEHHQFIEFLRFREIENHILLGKIHPKCNVVPLIAEHFADRFSGENWIIYDQGDDLLPSMKETVLTILCKWKEPYGKVCASERKKLKNIRIYGRFSHKQFQ